MSTVLLSAAKALNKRSYEMFKVNCMRAYTSLQTEETIDTNGNNVVSVSSVESLVASSRKFHSLHERCSCFYAVACRLCFHNGIFEENQCKGH